MKRILRYKSLCSFFLALITALSCIACGTEPTDTTPTTKTPAATTQSTETTQTTQQTTQTTQTTQQTTQTTETTSTSDDAHEPIDPPAVTVMRPAQEVRIVDFNLLAEEATVATRKEQMIPLLLSYEADSIGVQEARGSWVQVLRVGLGSRYGRVGVDAGGNPDALTTHFATYIYYRKDRYRVVESDTFWLTQTPDEPSAYNEKTTANRTCTWAVLEDMQTGFRYVHMNSHLDWQDEAANVVQSMMIRNLILRFEAMGYPVFATGDYNTAQGSPSYAQITAPIQISDAHFAAAVSRDPSATPHEKPIDFCFVTASKMQVLEYAVIDNVQNGVTISDHKGVFVHALVNSLPDQDVLLQMPAFSDETKVSVREVRGEVLAIAFAQAKAPDGSYPMRYRVTLKKADGTVVSQRNASAGFWLTQQPGIAGFFCRVPTDGASYRLVITPIGFLSGEGRPITVELIARSAPTAEAVQADKLIALQVVDGVAVDLSQHAYQVAVSGTVGLSNGVMNFTKKGCLKIDGIKNHYLTMQKGFAIEMEFETGADISTPQSICSNMHAGGYGIQLTDGKVQFVLYHAGAYRYTTAAVAANTTYHMVAVYDTETISLYVNGSLAAIKQLPPGLMGLPTNTASTHLCIGADSEPGGVGQNHADIVVSYVHVYSESLTDGNVRYLYEENQP